MKFYPCINSITKLKFLAVAGLMLAAFLPFSAAQAEDPPGCFSNGVTLSITVYRADGTTPVGGGTVESGETIKYGASLSHAGGSNCNFDQGTLTVTTPDGVGHVVASGGGIPLVESGSPFLAPQQPYVVSEADVAGGLLTAVVNYSNGVSYTPTIEQQAQAQVDISNLYEDIALEVEKTAMPAAGVTYRWDIDKTVSPAVWSLFNGDTGTSEYTITLTKEIEDSDYSVEGEISIYNPAEFSSAQITSVTDMIDGVGAANVSCPGGLPQELPPGDTLVCTYSSSLPNNATRLNTASIATSGDIDGNSGQADIDFTGVVPSEDNGMVNIDDTYAAGDAGPFTDSTEYSYEREFSCDSDEGTHNNTATIIETGQSDETSVTVNCYELSLEKTAETSFSGRYEWEVEKQANATQVSLSPDQSYDIEYTVTASVSGFESGEWMASGTITVDNPAPIAATINSVEDMVSGAGAASVDCGLASFPYTLPANSQLQCAYTIDLPNGNDRTNTAMAQQQHYGYDAQGIGTPTGTSDISGNADITFDDADDVTDDEVDVNDSYAGFLGTATVADSPKSFNYTRTVSFTSDECGSHTITNTATVTTNDTAAQDSDTENVSVNVVCEFGCVWTAFYRWHNPEEWPVNSLTLGNHSYTKDQLMTIIQTASRRTQGYWTYNSRYNGLVELAEQLIAAKLNVASGVESSMIDDYIAQADDMIGDQVIPPFGFGYLTKRATFALDSKLSNYNNGLLGPQNCLCLCLVDDLSAQSCYPKEL